MFYVPVFGMLALLYNVIKYFLLKPVEPSGIIICFFMFLLCGSVFWWGYNFPAIKYGNHMVGYINALLDFEEKVKCEYGKYMREKEKKKKGDYSRERSTYTSNIN